MSKAFDKVWHQGVIFKLKSVGVSDSLLSLIESFLSNRFQKVILNGQTSKWLPVKAGVPQGSIVGPLFYLIYINDLSDDLNSTVKLSPDDTSQFSVVRDSNISAYELNNDMKKISELACEWKMSCNPDLNKQAQEVIFSRKLNKSSHPKIFFNNAPVFCANWQNVIGMYLDETLIFNLRIKEQMSKALKGIGIIKKPSKSLHWHSLVTEYKSFVRTRDWRIRQSTTMLSFRNALLKIGRPIHKPVYNIHEPNGLRLLTRLRLGLSHLNEHKFNHNFKECVNPLCSCRFQVESVSHFFLQCHYFTDIRKTLFNELQWVDENILNQSDNEMVELLLYGSNKFNPNRTVVY